MQVAILDVWTPSLPSEGVPSFGILGVIFLEPRKVEKAFCYSTIGQDEDRAIGLSASERKFAGGSKMR